MASYSNYSLAVAICLIVLTVIGSLSAQGNGNRPSFDPPNFDLALSGEITIDFLNHNVDLDDTCLIAGSFREIDGTCGHPRNLGAAGRPLARLLRPQYGDGVATPKTLGVNGQPLPNPRAVSSAVHPDNSAVSDFTIMLMQWGQFMDHDMVNTPLVVEDTRRTHVCCGPDKAIPTTTTDPECFPILFPGGDPSFLGECMEFVRSQPLKRPNGPVISPRANLNSVTSFIDASTVYGSEEEIAKRLRTDNGKGFLFQLDNGRPIDNGRDDCLKRPGRNDVCYLAGDDRVNEQPGLTALHTIFMRLHNIWAQELKSFLPLLPDEFVFQRVREVVIGVTQNIMYNEWLPIILGQRNARRAQLLTTGNRKSRFRRQFDPSISHAFAAAVFRFGHTLIPKEVSVNGQTRTPMRDVFFQPYLLFDDNDDICTTLVNGTDSADRSPVADRFVVEEVTQHLFENEEGPMRGFDLLALNLQRARDQGLGSYNDYREYCGLPRVSSFTDPVLGDAGPLYQTVYHDPDDIELFSGGIAEAPFAGGIVGETFNCLMTRQFQALKFGDRFFHTHERLGTLGFTRRQIREIQTHTLSHIMCQTTCATEIQRDAFRKPGPGNRMVDCDRLTQTSLDIRHFIL